MFWIDFDTPQYFSEICDALRHKSRFRHTLDKNISYFYPYYFIIKKRTTQ